MPTTLTPEPTTAPPAPSEVCHLRRGGERVAACGAQTAIHHAGDIRFNGQSACPVHGTSICPTCRHIINTFKRGGGWEGP